MSFSALPGERHALLMLAGITIHYIYIQVGRYLDSYDQTLLVFKPH